MGLSLELQSCCVGAGSQAVAGSAVSGLVTSVMVGVDPILFLVDRMGSRTLFSMVVLGQGCASRSIVGFLDSKSVTGCVDGCGSHQVPGKVPARSLGGSLGRQDFPWTVAERG